jgi:hypothetical protein
MRFWAARGTLHETHFYDLDVSRDSKGVEGKMEKARIIDQKKIPKEIRLIFLDVNGTITKADEVDREILKQALNSAEKGSYIVFITGRDRIWLEKFLIEKIEQENPTEYMMKKMGFYPELGVYDLDPISKTPTPCTGVLDHSLIEDGSLKERISRLFLRTSDLENIEYDEQRRPGFYAVRDAEQQRYWYPIKTQNLSTDVIFYDFIWSESKEVISTAEVLRDDKSRIPDSRKKQIGPAAEILISLFYYWRIDEKVSVVPTSTAIDIVPVIDGITIDKSWAAGRALKKLSEQTGENMRDLASKSVAIGDGASDFKFSHPLNLENPKEILKVPFIFVGEEMPKSITPEERESIIIESTLGPDGQRYKGSEVTKEALDILSLWNL